MRGPSSRDGINVSGFGKSMVLSAEPSTNSVLSRV